MPKQLRSVVLAILPASRNANALLNNKRRLAPTTCLALLEPPPFENSCERAARLQHHPLQSRHQKSVVKTPSHMLLVKIHSSNTARQKMPTRMLPLWKKSSWIQRRWSTLRDQQSPSKAITRIRILSCQPPVRQEHQRLDQTPILLQIDRTKEQQSLHDLLLGCRYFCKQRGSTTNHVLFTT